MIKKTPIKALAILLALFVLLAASVGCGKDTAQQPDVSTPGGSVNPPTQNPSESVTLVTVTEQNISIKLPSSMTEQEGPYGGSAYADTETADVASFRVDRADEGFPMASMTEKEFVDFLLSDLDDLEVISYENNMTLNGNKAVVCKFSFTTPQGNDITAVFINVLYKGADYLISLTYLSDNEDGALAKNLQTIVESISVSY